MVIQTRQLVLLLAVVVVFSTMIAFAVAKATQPDAAAAKGGGSAAVVRELRSVNTSLDLLNRHVGSSINDPISLLGITYSLHRAIGDGFLGKDVGSQLNDISNYTERTCKAVENSTFC